VNRDGGPPRRWEEHILEAVRRSSFQGRQACRSSWGHFGIKGGGGGGGARGLRAIENGAQTFPTMFTLSWVNRSADRGFERLGAKAGTAGRAGEGAVLHSRAARRAGSSGHSDKNLPGPVVPVNWRDRTGAEQGGGTNFGGRGGAPSREGPHQRLRNSGSVHRSHNCPGQCHGGGNSAIGVARRSVGGSAPGGAVLDRSGPEGRKPL